MSASLEILKKQLESGFLPQAYLFWGDDNEAKGKATEYILESLLGDNFCVHPNFYEIIPQEGDTGRRSISIDLVRNLRARAFEKPFDVKGGKFGAKNVFVIRDIDLLRYDASSVLLKLLEEPPEEAFFLATTTNRTVILPTIRSRFLMLRFCSDVSQIKLEQVNKLKKLSYFDRFKEIPKIIEKNNLSNFIRESLVVTEDTIRAELTKGNDAHKSIDALERLLLAYRETTNPTINKRLLGEYCAMII